MARIFLGTFLNKAQQEKLGHLREDSEQLQDFWHRKINWINPSKLHMTWLFLGEQSPENIIETVSVLSQILKTKKTMTLTYDCGEFWPSSNRARMFVLTPSTVPNAIEEMGLRLREEFEHYLDKKENKPFHPHVTLMRLGEQGRDRLDLPVWFKFSEQLPIHHVIDTIALIESRPHTGEYEILKNFKLDP